MASMTQARLKAKEKKKRLKKLTERGVCRWCRGLPDCATGLKQIDFKNVDQMQRFVTPQGKIFSRKRSGNCNKAQRSIKFAIKHARLMALMPYVG